MAKVIINEAKIEDILTRGVENIYPDKESLKKLLMSGKQIKLYCGYDPTAATLHIGHGITIRKLAKFQELGHRVIFLFGDFTAMIGDPTDKAATRKQLTKEQVKNNLKNWKKQIKNIIDINKVDFRYNSKWLAKLSFTETLKLTSYFTAQQISARDMFKKRLAEGKDLYFHEFLYPVMQAYDSVAMDVDLEIGGSDQMFNMLAGRTLMKKMKNKEKFVLTTKLLEDPTGKKMGKSEGNMITLVDSPQNMYGKVMSWSDEMIMSGFEILTDISDETLAEVGNQLKLGKVNPRDLKMRLAYEVVKIYLGDKAAQEGEREFKRVFQQGNKPSEIPEVIISDADGKIGVLDLFVQAGLAKSNTEVRRLIKEGAVFVDNKKVSQPDLELDVDSKGLLLQRGKKQFARVVNKK